VRPLIVNKRTSQLTDAGVTHLARLTALTHLFLGGHTLTDKGVNRLEGLQQVQELLVGGTERHTGIAAMQAMCPGGQSPREPRRKLETTRLF
jgi:hypothetical protein